MFFGRLKKSTKKGLFLGAILHIKGLFFGSPEGHFFMGPCCSVLALFHRFVLQLTLLSLLHHRTWSVEWVLVSSAVQFPDTRVLDGCP